MSISDKISGAAGGSGVYVPMAYVSVEVGSEVNEVDFINVTGYDRYFLKCDDVLIDGGALCLALRTSTDNGVTFNSGSSDYYYTGYYKFTGAANVSNFNDSSNSSIILGVNISQSGNQYPQTVEANLLNFNSSTRRTLVRGYCERNQSVSSSYFINNYGSRDTAEENNALRLVTASNIRGFSGKFSLYGIKEAE